MGYARRALGRSSVVLALAVLAAAPAGARTERLQWLDVSQWSGGSSPIVGFRVHVGSEPGVYDRHLDVRMAERFRERPPAYQYALRVPDYATVFVAVTAYDDFGLESSYSNEQERRPPDSDGDGIPDDGAPGWHPCASGESRLCDDNCPYQPNPDQRDSGGIGSDAAADGIGDACQCGDVSGDGRVTVADGLMIQRALGDAAMPMPRPDLCDVAATPGCTDLDWFFLLRSLYGSSDAAIRQQCAPALPPGP